MNELDPPWLESRSMSQAARGAPSLADGADSAPAAVTLSQLEAFLASVPLGIVFLDRDLRIERTNAAFGEVMGGLATEPVGRELGAVLPQLAERMTAITRQVLATGIGVPEIEFSGHPLDDPTKLRHWRAGIFPVAADGTRASGIGVIVRDVSERVEAREREWRRVRHRAELYQLSASLVEASTTADVVQAIVHHTTTAFGAAGTVVARCTADGQHIELLDAEGMPPEVANEWRRFPTTAPVPLAYVARTGKALFLESAADWLEHFPELVKLATDLGHNANAIIPLTIEQSTVGALGIAFTAPRRFDEEERELAQIVARQCALALERARLREAEAEARTAAVAANQVKTKFLATMSHELRTPLNAIAGYTELLELEIHGPLTEAQRTDLSRIHRNINHLLGLVGNVLSLLRLESGHVDYRITDVPLDRVLEFVAEATGPQLAAKHLRGDVKCARGIVVRADEEKLRQILLNLLSNAIKFTSEGGSITTICSADADTVRIDVRDTGRGIKAHELVRIFDPFVQVDQRLHAPTEGSGLGLAISRELARGMGGDLTAASEPEVGSTFTLTLPRA